LKNKVAICQVQWTTVFRFAETEEAGKERKEKKKAATGVRKSYAIIQA